jgi:hypothetical protein
MGTDIHVYVEFYEKENIPKSKYWTTSNIASCFCKDLNFGRNYDLFSLISDVGRGAHSPLYRPTGFKNISPRLSYEVESEFYVKIIPDNQAEFLKHTMSSGKIITKSHADKLVENKSLIMVDDDRGRLFGTFGETILNLEQIMEIRKEHLITTLKYDPRQNLIDFIESKNSRELMNYNFSEDEHTYLFSTIKMMQALELNSSFLTRFVCWFDN